LRFEDFFFADLDLAMVFFGFDLRVLVLRATFAGRFLIEILRAGFLAAFFLAAVLLGRDGFF